MVVPLAAPGDAQAASAGQPSGRFQQRGSAEPERLTAQWRLRGRQSGAALHDGIRPGGGGPRWSGNHLHGGAPPAPETGVGRPAVRAYAAQAGQSVEDFLDQRPFPLLTPQIAGTAVVDLVQADAGDVAPAYVLNGAGLQELP